MAISYIFADSDTLSLNIDGQPYAVDASHKNWEAILEALRAGQFNSIPGLINEAKALQEFVGFANIEVNADYGTISYAGQQLHNTIVDHIFRLREEGFNINPMLCFLDNLMDNPSKRAVDELYGFLQAGGLPITEDGCFIAYKRVRDDYKSVHDGKTDNSIGTVLEMPRNLVDEDSNRTCSHGLHFCSHAYLKHFSGNKVVILKVNPRDVVSIPADYNDTKGRACRYEVIGELSPEEVEKALDRNVFTEAVYREEAKVEDAIDEILREVNASGPRKSAGQFARGYAAGYRDHSGDSPYNLDDYDGQSMRDMTDGQCVAFGDGYDQGWDASVEGLPPAWEWTGAKNDAPKDVAAPRQSSGQFARGYAAGYRDQREGVSFAALDFDCQNSYDLTYNQEDAFIQGYNKGWDDSIEGVAAKWEWTDVKETSTPQATPSFTNLQMYDIGYKDGRNGAHRLYNNSFYEEGFKDGKGHKPRKYK
jgi:hypothetical protein